MVQAIPHDSFVRIEATRRRTLSSSVDSRDAVLGCNQQLSAGVWSAAEAAAEQMSFHKLQLHHHRQPHFKCGGASRFRPAILICMAM